jgi:hypothetical protein
MEANQNLPIWNPTRAVGLSVILTPAFGSYLQASNWKALGKPDRAAASMKWFYFSLLVLVVMAFGSVFLARSTAGDADGSVRSILNGVALVYLIIWYALSGRHQVNYVKDTFGKTYAKKSMWKAVLTGLAGVIAYTAAVIGLMAATQGVANADGSTGSGGSSLNLAGLLGGSHGLDCAAPYVKDYIVEAYGKQLVESGIPDLVWAVRNNRVKVHVDTIHEIDRNNDAKTVDCAANYVIDFPKEDIDRSIQAQKQFAVMNASNTSLTDPTFTTPITYQMAVPSDAQERKQGPIVTMTTREDPAATKRLEVYAGDYEVLAFLAPDITATSVNSTPWDKSFKDTTHQACDRSASVDACICRLNVFEKYVGEYQMARIGYATQLDGGLAGQKFPNFKKLSQALQNECPLTTSLAVLLGDQATDVPPFSVALGFRVRG